MPYIHTPVAFPILGYSSGRFIHNTYRWKGWARSQVRSIKFYIELPARHFLRGDIQTIVGEINVIMTLGGERVWGLVDANCWK